MHDKESPHDSSHTKLPWIASVSRPHQLKEKDVISKRLFKLQKKKAACKTASLTNASAGYRIVQNLKSHMQRVGNTHLFPIAPR
jgi:hypothetical protein